MMIFRLMIINKSINYSFIKFKKKEVCNISINPCCGCENQGVKKYTQNGL